MRRSRAGTGHGRVYRPKGRDGKPTRWYWLKYRLPGDLKPRRCATEPPTDNEAEARRQLHARMGEGTAARVRREVAEDMTVNDLLDFYVLDCGDKGQPIQPGRVEAWRATLGHARALDVQRDHLDTVARRWRKIGPTWPAGERQLADGSTRRWTARDPKRVRPIGGASCNRLMSVLSRAYQLGKEKRGLLTALTFPHFEEKARGEYITEEQSIAIRDGFLARKGAAVKADVFRLAYLLGIRKGQLRRTHKRHVLIHGDSWRLRWAPHEHKGGKKTGKPHEVVLADEALDIVQRAWANRRPDCDYLFHIDGRPVGPMLSELKRTCEALGIPYGRSRGVVFHDTRHSAVTNFYASGISEPVAMSITGHADPTVFKRYNCRRDDVQADALARASAYLASQRRR